MINLIIDSFTGHKKNLGGIKDKKSIANHSFLLNLKNFLEISTRNNAQGMSEANEKINPIVPAVEGMDMSTPEMRPIMAGVLLKFLLRYITREKISKVTAFIT